MMMITLVKFKVLITSLLEQRNNGSGLEGWNKNWFNIMSVVLATTIDILLIVINYTWWMLCFKEGKFCDESYKERVKEMGNWEIEVTRIVEGKSHWKGSNLIIMKNNNNCNWCWQHRKCLNLMTRVESHILRGWKKGMLDWCSWYWYLGWWYNLHGIIKWIDVVIDVVEIKWAKKRIMNYYWHDNKLYFMGLFVPKLKENNSLVIQMHEYLGHNRIEDVKVVANMCQHCQMVKRWGTFNLKMKN